MIYQRLLVNNKPAVNDQHRFGRHPRIRRDVNVSRFHEVRGQEVPPVVANPITYARVGPPHVRFSSFAGELAYK